MACRFKKCLAYLLSILLIFNTTYAKPPTLTLDEAILLAVRHHPHVQISQLNHVIEKYNLYIQQWEFYPHYNLRAKAAFMQNGIPGQLINNGHLYSVEPGVSLLTPIGTTVSLSSVNTNDNNHTNIALSAEIMQPLLRGFGKTIVETALNDAKDAEVISRLNMQGMLQQTVTNVISAYLDLMFAKKILFIDQAALTRAEKSMQQTKLFIQSGHKAGNELVTVSANVASAKMQLENDENIFKQTRYALLTAIGLDPNTNISFFDLDIKKLINKYNLPTLDKTKYLVLQNDIQYQIDNITLHGSTTRNVLVAKDNARWQLNLTANMMTGNTFSGSEDASINNLFNASNQSKSIMLSLDIPIDNQPLKQAILNAKIALKQAQLALMQEKWSNETNAINNWNLVQSALRALYFAQDAERLQQKTYQLSFQKYLHGLIDSLELQSAQQSLIQSQQALLSAQISYLKALVNLDLLIGHTLKTWDIPVRF